MNRREFIQITGAVGALAFIPAPVAKALETLPEKAFGNFEVKGMQSGVQVRISAGKLIIWEGETTGGHRLYGRVPKEFNGKEINIRFLKPGHSLMEIRGHKFPHDGSTLKVAGWLEENSTIKTPSHAVYGSPISRQEFLAEPVPSRKKFL
jgi:hypothetical protein